MTDVTRDAKSLCKSKPQSRHTTVGSTGAPAGNLGHRHGDCLTTTSTSIEKNSENVKLDTNQRVVYPASNPISELGGAVGPKGSWAPEGAIVQVADMSKLEFRGPTRHIDRDEDAFAANACGTSIDGVARLAPSEPYQSHVLCTNAGQVAAAVNGAVRHPAGKADVVS